MKKLLTYDPDRLAPEQIKKPCSDCPFARAALHGWLGPGTVEEWLALASSDARGDCHVYSNVECAGLAIFRANICKMPRDPEALRLPSDRAIVFATPAEFRAHHESVPSKRAKKR